MEKFKQKIEPGNNVVTFDGLSIPQEQVYKNSYLSYNQSQSYSKFLSSYKNEFEKCLNGNKKSNTEQQSQNWVGKEIEETLLLMKKFQGNSGTSMSSCTSVNKNVSLKHSTAKLAKYRIAVTDHSVSWKQNGEEDTRKSLSDCQSNLSQMNGTNVIEDSYLFKIDPSKLQLTDIDYLRAKCRWNYKNISDYAFNPKVLERIRYLEMFTQFFSAGNDENDYNFGDTDGISVEYDNSGFGNGDDLDVYKDYKLISYNKREIENWVSIPERENSSVGLQENVNVDISSIFRPNVYTVSIPNMKEASKCYFSSDSVTKLSGDPTVNAKLDRKNNQFKTVLPQARKSRKPLFTTSYDQNDRNFSVCNNSSVTNNKSKGCFTTSCHNDVESSRDSILENLNSCQHESGEGHGSGEVIDLKGNGSNIKHVSKEQLSQHCLFKDEETQYQNVDCEPTGSLEHEDEDSYVDVTDSSDEVHKSYSDSNSENSIENSGTLSSKHSSSQEKNSAQTSSSVVSEQLSEEGNHPPSLDSFGACSDNISSNTARVISEPQHCKNRIHTVKKKPSGKFYFGARLFGGGNDKNEYITSYSTNNDRISDDAKEEDFDDDSEISESGFSSKGSENADCSELFSKYFLNEFITGELKPEFTKDGAKVSMFPDERKNFNSADCNRKLRHEESDNKNENLNVTATHTECKNKFCNFRSSNKECTHGCVKEENPIIIIEFNCDKNSEIESTSDLAEKINTHHKKFDGRLKSERFSERNKNGNKKTFGTCDRLNYSNTDSKLTPILEGSDTFSETNKSCNRNLDTLDSPYSVTDINKETNSKKVASTVKHFKQPTNFESDMDSDMSDDYLKCKPPASSLNDLSSESSLSESQLKTKKGKKPKKRKIKKRQYVDYRKHNDNLMKTSQKEKRKQINYNGKRSRNIGQNTYNNKNTGQNVYVSSWKKYCVIL